MVNCFDPRFDLRNVGRRLSRERYQRGSLKKVGKTRKMWRGRWHIYLKQPDGTEKICKREKVIGPVSELTRSQAQEKLDALIKSSTLQIGAAPPMAATFSEVWRRYAELKSASWDKTTRQTVQSIFIGGINAKQCSVLSLIGDRKIRELTLDPLQDLLNTMAARGDSSSKVKKVRTYIGAALEYAVGEGLITNNPARKLELPTKLLAEPCERFYSLDEIHRLLSNAHGREHLVLRIFINCGLRPGELFALRENDIQPGKLRIDEAIKEKELGAKRIGRTKTVGSCADVAISEGLQEELEIWIKARHQVTAYHSNSSQAPTDLLFPSEVGTTFRIGNYLKRYLKPLAKRVGINDMTYQALRRTCATHFQKHGNLRDIQAQLRHTKLEMTGRYVKEIPDAVRSAVDSMDRELCPPLKPITPM